MKVYNVQKNYTEFQLSVEKLHIPENTITGLVGANGCGKSTLLKILAGILPQDCGTIEYGELTPRDITLIPRKPYLLHDTVYNNLVYPLKVRKQTPNKETVEYFLELIGFQNRQKQYAPSLSNGEQQKLALARAMIFQPKLIMIDEAFTNLDIESRTQFEALILQNQKEKPVTWLVVSHQLSHIDRLCTHMIFMHKGKIMEQGPAYERLRNPQTQELKIYLQNELLPQ